MCSVTSTDKIVMFEFIVHVCVRVGTQFCIIFTFTSHVMHTNKLKHNHRMIFLYRPLFLADGHTGHTATTAIISNAVNGFKAQRPRFLSSSLHTSKGREMCMRQKGQHIEFSRPQQRDATKREHRFTKKNVRGK